MPPVNRTANNAANTTANTAVTAAAVTDRNPSPTSYARDTVSRAAVHDGTRNTLPTAMRTGRNRSASSSSAATAPAAAAASSSAAVNANAASSEQDSAQSAVNRIVSGVRAVWSSVGTHLNDSWERTFWNAATH